MIKLNFTISELLHSDEAKRHGINNIPDDVVVLDNMLTLITECLQPIRNYIGKPMIISSGYRCNKINALVGGAKNSQHLSGCAVDFTVKGLTIKQIIDKIKASNIEYDQLINEYNRWVHISYNKGKNRKQNFNV